MLPSIQGPETSMDHGQLWHDLMRYIRKTRNYHNPLRCPPRAWWLCILLIGCEGKSTVPEKPTPPPVPVVAGVVQPKTMPVRLRVFGHVEAQATVTVKARVDGPIRKVQVREGQEVEVGTPLFELDPRPFEILERQAEANLARDRAKLDNARQEERRQQELVRQKLVSQEQYEQIRTERQAAEATLRADEAMLEQAKLQLEYCRITSPIRGRVGSLLTHQGNLVKANDTALLVINQITPIDVGFAVPEPYLGTIKSRQSQGPLLVEASLPQTDQPPLQGQLSFIDNAVDDSTGTIRLKAQFRNEQQLLWPGQFVAVTLTLYEQPEALVIPASALQTGPKGHFVFVLKDEDSVALREVRVDRTDESEAVIAQGLQAGERLILEGQSRLANGSKVKIKNAGPSPIQP